ncbi:IclR family transcriptional regulator [Pseudorhodobacter sp. E13]|uniref:IclR family transcriptional regulator n=1 Tax=Pseudorhodobacter sp. E13 TaxID=2487931 RepID=UPI00210110A2|nr:IclR family transcriptional regulator [Pseudorhodobacter sp. E13]
MTKAITDGAASGDGTVGKALDVLDMVANHGAPVRFTELLTQSPFPKATLYRFLQTLTHQNLLSYDAERQTYALGMRLVRLAHTAWAQSSLAPLARPHLDALSAKLGETIHLAQLDQGQVLYVDKRNAAQPVEMFSSAGKVGPAYCTGVGKAMMAFLPPEALEQALNRQSFYQFTPHTYVNRDQLCAELEAIRARGYAFDREEHEPNIICVAAPILTDRGRPIGAISVTSTLLRTNLTELETLAPQLLAVANNIAMEARDWRFPEQ